MRINLTFVLLLFLMIILPGCTGLGEKGVNKDKDRPKPAAK